MKEELKTQLKMIYEVLASEEFTDAVADYVWKLFTKLKAKGFTEDQALKIVAQMARSSEK